MAWFGAKVFKPGNVKVDPICGMTVDEATALQAERDGETYYFCSESCRQKFLARKAPLMAVSHGGGNHTAGSMKHDGHGTEGHSGSHEHGHVMTAPAGAAKYFCPMHPEVQMDHPGDCPKCGMTLEQNPAWVAPLAGKVIYTCPMHPEVQMDHPGECPKCGMSLEPKTLVAVEEEDPELIDMTRRFWLGGMLALPVFLLAMAHLIPSASVKSWAMGDTSRWIQFGLSTPVVLWAG